MCLVNQGFDFHLLFHNNVRDGIIGDFVRDQVAHADTVTTLLHILGHNILQIIHEMYRFPVAIVIANTVDQTIGAVTEHTFL